MPVKRLWPLLLLLVFVAGCRDVRVKTMRSGTTTVAGGNEIVVVRDARQLEHLGVHAPVRFKSEFAVVLLMGTHERTGFRQIIESIRANQNRVRVVAFESPPADGGEPSARYRTYTLWIVPNSVYKSGVPVEVVTPSGDAIANTTLP